MAYGIQIYDSAGTLKVDLGSNLVALADVSTGITVTKNGGTFTKTISELDNSGVWYVFLDGSLVSSGGFDIYTSVYNPTITYNSGSYTLTNGNTAYDWKGTAFVYRTA